MKRSVYLGNSHWVLAYCSQLFRLSCAFRLKGFFRKKSFSRILTSLLAINPDNQDVIVRGCKWWQHSKKKSTNLTREVSTTEEFFIWVKRFPSLQFKYLNNIITMTVRNELTKTMLSKFFPFSVSLVKVLERNWCYQKMIIGKVVENIGEKKLHVLNEWRKKLEEYEAINQISPETWFEKETLWRWLKWIDLTVLVNN